jgi:hypothetical protein
MAMEKGSIPGLTLLGVSPPPLWLPSNAITPEQVIQHYRAQHRGGLGGQARSLPL